jgi:hypothetical protein
MQKECGSSRSNSHSQAWRQRIQANPAVHVQKLLAWTLESRNPTIRLRGPASERCSLSRPQLCRSCGSVTASHDNLPEYIKVGVVDCHGSDIERANMEAR